MQDDELYTTSIPGNGEPQEFAIPHVKAPIMFAGPGVRYAQCVKCAKLMQLGSFHQAGDHLCCPQCPTNLLLVEMTMVEWAEYQQAQLYGEKNSTITEAFKTLKPSAAPMWGAGSCGGRDSKEADAAQYYHTVLGVPQSVLINFATGDFSPMHKGLMIDGELYMPKPVMVLRHGCPYTLERVQGGKTIICDELIKQQLDVVGALRQVPVEHLIGSKTGGAIPIREYEQYIAGIQKQQADLADNLLEVQAAVARCAFQYGVYARDGIFQRDPHARKELKDKLADELKALGLTWADVERVVRNMDGAIKNV